VNAGCTPQGVSRISHLRSSHASFGLSLVFFWKFLASLKDFLNEMGQVGRVVQSYFANVDQILDLRWHGSKKAAGRFRQ